MLIESKLLREGGTKVELYGVEYHFRPTREGAHVCEVAAEDAVDRFLAIAEGYRLFRGKETFLAEPASKEPAATESLIVGPLPAGSPVNLDQMDRDQLLDYAALLGMRKPHPAIGDEKLRANISAFLDLRGGDEEPEENEG